MKTFAITLFAIAMALLESAVVIYLRQLYYPSGFDFPLAPMHTHIVFTELWRELATLIMLLCIGYLADTKNQKRFAWFIYAFAVWDIFYYVFLHLFIHWPTGLWDWDVLFLIPFLWTGPVLSPILISISMIGLWFAIMHGNGKITTWSAAFMLTGSLLCLIAFMYEFCHFHLLHHSSLFQVTDLLTSGYLFIPHKFPWLTFICGYVLINTGILFTLSKQKNQHHAQLFV